MHRTRARARADRFQQNCNSFSRIVDRDISSYYNANLLTEKQNRHLPFIRFYVSNFAGLSAKGQLTYLKKCWAESIVCDHLDRSISPVVSSPEIQLFMSIF